MSNEDDVLPGVGRRKHKLCLRLTAEMFRQHSRMFLQQAAVLERVATHPDDPDSWRIDEVSPESVHDSLLKENVTIVAKKSYESMLQVQKRVDFLERTMVRKGIKPLRRTGKVKPPVKKKLPKAVGKPFFHFSNEQGPRIAASLGLTGYTGNVVRTELLKIWSVMNPRERQPYLEKAAAARGEDSEGARAAKKPATVADDVTLRDTASSSRIQSDQENSEQEQSESDSDDLQVSHSQNDSDDDSGDEASLLFVRKT